MNAAPIPTREANVIMKGGITSGVVYPGALAEFARSYRLRSLGGASAGAIGAAFGAAAEHGRQRGHADAFERLRRIPDQLGEGALAALFVPQRATAPLLRLMLALTGHDAEGPPKDGLRRIGAVLSALIGGFRMPWVIATLLGIAIAACSAIPSAGPGWIVVGVIVVGLGSIVGWALAVARALGRAFPDNQFGICTGLGTPEQPGFTDWLNEQLNGLACQGDSGPLLYGQLWSGTDDARLVPEGERSVDLRLVSTCLSQGRPYEMPWEGRTFFYEVDVWRQLFPADVMAALDRAAPAGAPSPAEADEWAWEEKWAAAAGLRRLPEPHELPVLVSVRMSLSYPLLISAIPLWMVNRRSEETTAAVKAFRASKAATTEGPLFSKVWFTDGGFCSNFPIHLFDEALPTRPTFAVDLGAFVGDRQPSPDQSRNIEYSRNNRALQPSYRPIAEKGLRAPFGFLAAAIATSREWPDATQLSAPGMRDRIVRVLQSSEEGGLNLFMDRATITGLSLRGEAAAEALVTMFTTPQYGGSPGAPAATGWDNHRWVRYRALQCALPHWYASFAAGHQAMAGLDPAAVGSYPLSRAARGLADKLTAQTLASAKLVDDPAHADAVRDLVGAPRPATVLRRVPQL